jgi:4-amino-4-deoxy-L-arabinose transferase-like glycosyltransferase
VILWLAVGSRLSSLLLLHNFTHPHCFEFGDIARNYLEGKGFSYFTVQGVNIPTAYMPPAYSWLLIAFFKIFGDRPTTYVLLQTLQALAGVLLVYIVYRFTRVAWDSDTALVAALISALYPPFLYMPAEMHSINFYVVLMLAATYYLFLLLEVRSNAMYAVLAGLLLGLLIYFRAEMLAWPFLYAIVVLLKSTKQWRSALTLITLPLLMLTPWAVRNYLLFGQPVLTTTAGGINLWYGHNSQANGTQRERWPSGKVVLPDSWLQQKLDAIPPTASYEIQASNLYRKEAILFARSNVKREVELAVNKLWYFWTFDWNHPKAHTALYAGPTLALGALFWLGLIVERRDILGRHRALIVIVLFTNCLAAVFFVLPRYRLAMDPCLIPFAASALLWGWRASRARNMEEFSGRLRDEHELDAAAY